MTFYNYIENVRYEMFKFVNGWTHKGAKTKARISESLDQARREYMRMESENDKLRKLVDGWNFCSKTKSSTFDNCVGCPLFIQTPHSYRCTKNERMRELGIKVNYK